MDSELDYPELSELSLVFCSDEEIQTYNRDYRGKDRPTDVLSFSQIEGAEAGESIIALGDVVVSLDSTKKQAEERGLRFEEELLRLLIHGVLHLVGYDHEDVSEEEVLRMQRREDELFERFESEISTVFSS